MPDGPDGHVLNLESEACVCHVSRWNIKFDVPYLIIRCRRLSLCSVASTISAEHCADFEPIVLVILAHVAVWITVSAFMSVILIQSAQYSLSTTCSATNSWRIMSSLGCGAGFRSSRQTFPRELVEVQSKYKSKYRTWIPEVIINMAPNEC